MYQVVLQCDALSVAFCKRVLVFAVIEIECDEIWYDAAALSLLFVLAWKNRLCILLPVESLGGIDNLS